jgi:hypothetical protein
MLNRPVHAAVMEQARGRPIGCRRLRDQLGGEVKIQVICSHRDGDSSLGRDALTHHHVAANPHPSQPDHF